MTIKEIVEKEGWDLFYRLTSPEEQLEMMDKLQKINRAWTGRTTCFFDETGCILFNYQQVVLNIL